MSWDGWVGGMITCVGLAYILVGWGGYLPTDELGWVGGWDDYVRWTCIHTSGVGWVLAYG